MSKVNLVGMEYCTVPKGTLVRDDKGTEWCKRDDDMWESIEGTRTSFRMMFEVCEIIELGWQS